MKFSIVIPTYKREELLRRGLLSIIAQDYKDWEIIVVDDGGNDGTEKMISNLNEPRIIYFWKINEERGIARNFGVSKSNGDYVFFLDSDDIIFPNHLTHAATQIEKNNKPGLFHSRYQEWYPDKKVNSEKLNQKNINTTITSQNKFACQFFLRSDVAKEIPFAADRNIKIGEDWLVILRVSTRHKIVISNEYTSAIIHHAERSMIQASADEILRSRDGILKILSEDLTINKDTIKKVNVELTTLAALAFSIDNKRWLSLKLLKSTAMEEGNILIKKRTFATLKKILFGR